VFQKTTEINKWLAIENTMGYWIFNLSEASVRAIVLKTFFSGLVAIFCNSLVLDLSVFRNNKSMHTFAKLLKTTSKQLWH